MIIISKIQKTFYGIVLPTFVVIALLGFASFNEKPQILGSTSADFIVRFMLALWFCGLYIRLSQFSSFSFFPNRKWSRSDVTGLEKYFYLGLISLFCIGCGIITFWVIRWFFPELLRFALIFAAMNGFVIFLPMATQYWVIKL